MALLRNLIIWCCLLAPAVSFAETIAATAKTAGTSTIARTQGFQTIDSSPANWSSSYGASCDKTRTFYGKSKSSCNDAISTNPWSDGQQRVTCYYYEYGNCQGIPNTVTDKYSPCPANYTASGSNCSNTTTFYECPSTGGWTLSGQSCTRPDCTPPDVRNSVTGLCVPPACTAGRTFTGSFFGGWRVGPAANQVVGPSGGSYSAPVTQCNGGCVFTSGGATCTSTLAPFVDQAQPITCTGTLTETGAECSVDNTATPSTAPVIPNHRPKCLPTEGVLTSSSGTVACVPSGTPSSVPVVRSDKVVQQFPDGSAKTTETTYTKDPATGVQDTQQTITNTPATAGGTGMAGTPGTTSTGASTQPSTGTDKTSAKFCEENAQLQICQGDMNKEETQLLVKQAMEKVKDSLSTEGFDSAQHFNDLDASQTAKDYAADKVAEITGEVAKFGTALDPSATKYAQFEDAMGGWFDPITITGCSPFTANIGPWVWNLDICPIAAKISEIGAYVMWVLLAFGVFALVTKEGR